MDRRRVNIDQIESMFGLPLESILKDMRQQGLSASQMYQEVINRTGLSFSKRVLQRWLKKFGIAFERDEAGKLRWQNGLMNEAAKKSRRTLHKTMIMGSKIEEQVRWVLKNDLEDLEEYETIIGFTNWTILDGLEIDIPIVCIQKSSQKIFKFALEIDGERFHSNKDWEHKEKKIKEAGWHPLRIVINSQELSRKSHQVYIKNNVRALVNFDPIISSIKVILQNTKPRQ